MPSSTSSNPPTLEDVQAKNRLINDLQLLERAFYGALETRLISWPDLEKFWKLVDISLVSLFRIYAECLLNTTHQLSCPKVLPSIAICHIATLLNALFLSLDCPFGRFPDSKVASTFLGPAATRNIQNRINDQREYHLPHAELSPPSIVTMIQSLPNVDIGPIVVPDEFELYIEIEQLSKSLPSVMAPASTAWFEGVARCWVGVPLSFLHFVQLVYIIPIRNMVSF